MHHVLHANGPYTSCNQAATQEGDKVTSLQALLRKAFRSPGVLVLGDFGIFCLILLRASREVKISRKCLTCLPKPGSSATGNNSHSALQYGTRTHNTPKYGTSTIMRCIIGHVPATISVQQNFFKIRQITMKIKIFGQN